MSQSNLPEEAVYRKMTDLTPRQGSRQLKRTSSLGIVTSSKNDELKKRNIKKKGRQNKTKTLKSLNNFQ